MVDLGILACYQCEQPATAHEQLVFVPGIYHGSAVPVVIVLHRQCQEAWEAQRLSALAAEGVGETTGGRRTLLFRHRWVRKDSD